MVSAYTALHEKGYVVSAESWQKGKLVGGLYGVLLGLNFFERVCSAKYPTPVSLPLSNLYNISKRKNIQLIDCQIYTTPLK
jgi:leucyl/phenylalanyl-tRNA--protein transferase